MTLEEIITQVRDLTSVERENLMQHLRELKEQDKEMRNKARAQENAETYKEMLADLLGCSVDFESRRSNQIKAKMCIAYMLYMDGFSEETIGFCLRKHHSTINVYKGELEDVLTHPYYDPALAEMWKNFRELCSR